MVITLENLPNEILIECFKYFHTLDLLHSFGHLNHRFEQLLQTLPLHLDLEDITRETYDAFRQDLLLNPDAQQRVCSLRLSNRSTPGITDDFLSKFSLDQFSRLRSLTFLDLPRKGNWLLTETLPKLSQITALHIFNSKMPTDKLKHLIPIDTLQTLSIDSNLIFVERTISIKSLMLDRLSLNEICRLFQYTPLLRYFKVSSIREEIFEAEYHRFPRPPHLTDLNLGYFKSTFNDLTHFLQNMSNLRSLTIHDSKDENMVDASRWEELITSSLPRLKDFRFVLTLNQQLDKRSALAIFDRFQTNFWLREHQWYTECSVNTKYTRVYTILHMAEYEDIYFGSKRYCNPLIDNSQIFKHVKKLSVSAGDLFEHSNYHFPNLTSLIIWETPDIFTEYDEEQMIESPMKLMSFSYLKHLEITLGCGTQLPSQLFRILELAPQLSSLRTEPCFFELLLDQPESHRHLVGKIRKLDLSDDYFGHDCRGRLSVPSLYRIVPNVEQLTMSLISVDDLFFLLNRFSKLSSFSVGVSPYDHGYERFKMQALKQNALLHEDRSRGKAIGLGVWIRRDTVVAKPEQNPEWSLPHLQYKYQRIKEQLKGSQDMYMSCGGIFDFSDSD